MGIYTNYDNLLKPEKREEAVRWFQENDQLDRQLANKPKNHPLRDMQVKIDHQIALFLAEQDYINAYKKTPDREDIITSQKKILKKCKLYANQLDKSGLPNVANTCWMNASIQLLRSIPRAPEEKGYDLRDKFEAVVSVANGRNRTNARSKCTTLARGLEQVNSDEFQYGRHNDPSQFIRMSTDHFGVEPARVEATIVDSEDGYSSRREKNETLLEIKLADSIQQTVKNFFEPEEVPGWAGNTRVNEENGGRRVRRKAKKQYRLKSAPDHLILRVSDRILGEYNGKRHKVTAPMQLNGTVSIDDVDEKRETVQYEVKDIIVHKGKQANFGHYICYKKQEDGSFIKYDDCQVTGPFSYEQIKDEIEQNCYIIRLERLR